jgi:hypothetical protein
MGLGESDRFVHDVYEDRLTTDSMLIGMEE